jgi:hypothetical protein
MTRVSWLKSKYPVAQVIENSGELGDGNTRETVARKLAAYYRDFARRFGWWAQLAMMEFERLSRCYATQ